MILRKLKEKAREIKSWAEEHPFWAATVVIVGTLVTGGLIYMVVQNVNGEEELVAMPNLHRYEREDETRIPTAIHFDGPVRLEPEVERVGQPIDIVPPEEEESYAYRLGSRREHLRNIAPRNASDRAQALAAEMNIKLPDHHTLVRASNPRIRCAVDDPRAILPIEPPDGEEASRLLDLWDEDEIVVMLIGNMETLDSEVFEKLYGRLDVDQQIEVDESIGEFANNAVGCDYWDSDD